jgi:hypothetical protein
MGEAGQLSRIVLTLLALSIAGCRWSTEANHRASVTVRLPPAKPYVPTPSFSFGGTPRAVSVAATDE